MTTITLGIYGIILIKPDDGETLITSNMQEEDTPENEAFNAAIDGIESLILSQYSVGIDVTSKAYLKSIEEAYSAISRNFSD